MTLVIEDWCFMVKKQLAAGGGREHNTCPKCKASKADEAAVSGSVNFLLAVTKHHTNATSGRRTYGGKGFRRLESFLVEKAQGTCNCGRNMWQLLFTGL